MNKELAKTIGTTARHARKAQRLTQEDAAERIGVSVEFYARIERGTSLPSILTFARIVSALGVSADAMLGQHPLSTSAGLIWTPEPPNERPEIRRLLRRLRQASPGALRLVGLLLKEFEMSEHNLPEGRDTASNADESGSSDAGPGFSGTGGRTVQSEDERSVLAASEMESRASGDDFDGAPARTLRSRESEAPSTSKSDSLEWERAS